MDVFLVRHGTMLMDTGEIKSFGIDLVNQYITGQKEQGLSPEGVKEIGKVADFFRTRGVTAIYSSNFARAKESAAVLSSALNLPSAIIEELGEINVGILDPRDFPRLEKITQGVRRMHGLVPALTEKTLLPLVGRMLIYTYLYSWTKDRTRGGEEMAFTLTRIDKVFSRLAAENPPEAKVVAFTHGYFIMASANLAVRRRPQDLWRIGNPFWIPNGSVSRFRVAPDGSRRLLYFARAHHLKGNVRS